MQHSWGFICEKEFPKEMGNEINEHKCVTFDNFYKLDNQKGCKLQHSRFYQITNQIINSPPCQVSNNQATANSHSTWGIAEPCTPLGED